MDRVDFLRGTLRVDRQWSERHGWRPTDDNYRILTAMATAWAPVSPVCHGDTAQGT
jgi:hypothetical protein